MDTDYNLLVITGPTACGKTAVAAHFAADVDGEILSADSRQVYRGMDVGTGKDLSEYCVNGKNVPFHLIDIVDAGYKYNVYEYQKDFYKAYADIVARGKFPVLCGGTGLYINAVIRNYDLVAVPPDPALRRRLAPYTLPELEAILRSYKPLHNNSDIDTVKRAVRAIEIADYYRRHPEREREFPALRPLIVGIYFDRDTRRRRITERLTRRLHQGMLEEVRRLVDGGLSYDDLEYYGLEYKFLSAYARGRLTYPQMSTQLNTAIHQFAKRQMTWFRKMEREGTVIRWIDGNLPVEAKIEQIKKLLASDPAQL